MTKVYDTATDLITFARGSSATYTGSDGTQQTAASDEPRIEYAADGTLKGLLIEEQRTNLLLNSDNPDTQVATLPAGSHTLSFVGGPSATGISDTITATAVDVFVYDTSKDSDGGAWRTGSLAQASSWYNETLNTSTRGSRREFPAVAVIVAESNKVTIYDGDDPSLPMWIEWAAARTPNSTLGWWRPNQDPSCITAKNGTLCFGLDASGGSGPAGLAGVSLLGDFVFRYNDLASRGGYGFDASSGTKPNDFSTQFSEVIVNAAINDVTMTVLPDAPTDPATGLPVPTIAVATDGGVSVIKDDGTVVDSLESGGSGGVGFVGFDASGRLYYARDEYYGRLFFSDTYAADGFGPGVNSEQVWNGTYHSNSRLLVGLNFSDQVELGNLNLVHLGGAGAFGDEGLGHILFDHDTPGKSLHAVVTSSYATGWMNGDIKGAFLSDTDDTDLVGSGQLVVATWVTPVGYDNTTTGTGSSVSVLSGTTDSRCAVVVSGLVAGKVYVVSVTIDTSPGSVGIYVRDGSVAGTGTIIGNAGSAGAGETKTVSFVAVSSSANILLARGSADDFSASGVTMYLADPDRSVNNNGLGVHGSITKAPVATGADVVAYSGFSYFDYLEQPYNSDLDFGAYTGTAGTGDFCYMGWLSDFDNWRTVLWRGTDTAASFVIDPVGTTTNARINVGGIANITPCVHWTNDWRHMAVLRASGIVSIYLNGVLQSSFSAAHDLTLADATLRFGEQSAVSGSGNYSQGSLALWRISATAPTADQIAKIYEDERPLFQPNAKATLTGSSDAVTALAHDPDTDLLHVGTSGGRSVFYGLRRVNETATAVTTAISAVDGLIVEQ